jgi:hypothetical protein
MIKGVGNAGTLRKRAPEPVAAQSISVADQRPFEEESVSDRAFHPYLSVEQRAALVVATQSGLATRPELIEQPAAGMAKNRLKTLGLFTAVFLIAASATFALAYLHTRESAAMESVPRVIQDVPVRSARLGMRAQAHGDSLLLSWNGNSPALQSATGGLLQIDDGPEHREIALDAGGIAGAALVYRPISDDVVFRLELSGSGGVRTAETLEVVGTRTHEGDFKAQPEVTTPNAGKTLTQGPVADRSRSRERAPKEVKNADAGPKSVTRASQKLSQTELPAIQRPSAPMVAMQKPPSLSMSGLNAPQSSSSLSGLELPKPPAQPSNIIREATPGNGTNTTAAAANTASQPSGVANLGYVPPRPIKWAAPSAKSLGISRVSTPTDFEIKVRIDESGRVTAAHALLDRARHDEAVTAAVTGAVRQWIFEPAKMQGKNVASEQTVIIRVDPRN